MRPAIFPTDSHKRVIDMNGGERAYVAPSAVVLDENGGTWLDCNSRIESARTHRETVLVGKMGADRSIGVEPNDIERIRAVPRVKTTTGLIPVYTVKIIKQGGGF